MSAEHGAHLSSSVGVEAPTIFEVLAQESLMQVVRPAVKHAVMVLAENKPARFGWLLRYFDELYSSLDLALQKYYLHMYNGSFAENFYSLKRVSTSSPLSQLSNRHQMMSLTCLVLFPYIKNKMDKWYEDRRETNSKTKHSLLRALLAVYPYAHMSWEGVRLVYQLAYTLGYGRFHSPLLQASGTQLCRLGEEEFFTSTDNLADWSGASIGDRLRQILRKLFDVFCVSLSTSLSVSVFFLQFLDWWYSSDTNAPTLTALPIPDPPQCTEQQGVGALSCQICRRVRTNDTALSVSGYVFCYPCIHDHIKEHGCCPVTGCPARTEHLIKLYPPDG